MEYSNESDILTGIETELEIEFKTPKDAEIVLKSIKPEIKGSPSDRSSVCIDVHENTLRISIDAKDTASFRASLNSYLRWIKLSYEVINLKNEYL